MTNWVLPRRTRAQAFYLVFGAAVLVGSMTFVVESIEASSSRDLVQIASGLAGLALWRNPAATRTFVLGLGVVYGLVMAWGVIDAELAAAVVNGPAFAESRFGSQAMMRLRAAFQGSRNPMLIADDERRWVTGNSAACDLLGIGDKEVPWRTMDEFTPPSERARLEDQWDAFLASGEAEGWYDLYVPHRGPVPVEFSATANVLPSRHLAVFIPPDEASSDTASAAEVREAAWTVVAADGDGRLHLTDREREVMVLVASGLQSADMAERLFVSTETVKTHVQNAMGKLGVHTRAHAVAVALVTGEITLEI